jgi:hypothetical protein
MTDENASISSLKTMPKTKESQKRVDEPGLEPGIALFPFSYQHTALIITLY